MIVSIRNSYKKQNGMQCTLTLASFPGPIPSFSMLHACIVKIIGEPGDELRYTALGALRA